MHLSIMLSYFVASGSAASKARDRQAFTQDFLSRNFSFESGISHEAEIFRSVTTP